MPDVPTVAEGPEPAKEQSNEQSDPKEAAPQHSAEQAEELVAAEEAREPDVQDVDAELEEMKQRLAQMEAESAGANETSASELSAQAIATNGGGVPDQGAPGIASAASQPAFIPGGPVDVPASPDSVADADARSIYVGNVDYAATGDQLSSHFADCGTINRVTIMCNKTTGQPKGFAYIEFQDHLGAKNALILNGSNFLGRPLKIVAKRTNIPAAYRGGYGRGRPRYTRGGRGFSRRPRRSWRGRWSPY